MAKSPQRHWFALLFLGLVLIAAPSYAENENRSEDTKPLPPAEVVKAEPSTVVAGEVDGHAAPYEIVVGRGKRARAYSILAGPPTEQHATIYGWMTNDEKKAFELKRLSTLKTIAGVLHSMPITVGAFSAAHEKVGQAGDWFWGRNQEARGPPPATLRERGYQAIQRLLLEIDSQLYSRAPVIANANEYGFTTFAGVGAAAMIGNKGWGEGTGLGLYIGYSPSLHRITLELYWGREKVQKATVALKAPTAVLKMMFSMHRRMENDPAVLSNSRGVYPIYLPGVGRVFTQDGPASAHVGMVTGWPIIPGTGAINALTAIPELGTGLDAWIVRGTRVPLLRVTVKLPKEGQNFGLKFQTAVDFRALVLGTTKALVQGVRYTADAVAGMCSWTWRKIARLCGVKSKCEPPAPPPGGEAQASVSR